MTKRRRKGVSSGVLYCRGINRHQVKVPKFLIFAILCCTTACAESKLRACNANLDAGTYGLTQDIGADPTTVCLATHYPSGPITIRLKGHTVTGLIDLSQTNQTGNKIVGPGTVLGRDGTGIKLGIKDTVDDIKLRMDSAKNCSRTAVPVWSAQASFATGDCANAAGEIYRSLRDANTNHAVGDGVWWTIGAACPGLVGIDFLGIEPSNDPYLQSKILNSEITIGRCDGARRTQAIRASGANGSNPAIRSASVEILGSTITCSENASSCQGAELWASAGTSVHNNVFDLPSSCATCQDSARAVIFDGNDGGRFYRNTVYTRSNRAVRVRSHGSKLRKVEVYDNQFLDVRAGGRFGAVHIGENDSELQVQNVNVYSNKFQLGREGNGVACVQASGCDVHDNAVSCTPDCAKVGYFAVTQVVGNYALTGTVLTLSNNDLSELNRANKQSVFACSGEECVVGSGSTTVVICHSGTVAGSGIVKRCLPDE